MANPVLSVLTLVSNQLSTFLTEETKLLGTLGQEIQLISDELGHIKAFLEVAESKKEDDPQLTEWIRQVKEAAYDTEDVIDEFMLLFSRHPPRGVYDNLIWNFNTIKNLPDRYRLSTRLQSIKARIKNISEARLRYESHYANIPAQVPGRLVENNPWRHNKDDDALLAEEAQLVGIDKPKKYLISQLLECESQLKVITVLGMGGIGKTTLVKKVFDHEDVKSHFQIRAWVTVSKTCDFQELLKGLVRQLQAALNEQVHQPMASLDICQLKGLVKDYLEKARYTIVFDDVWDTEFWDAFKFVLPQNPYGGNCVLLTTRITDVASAACTKVHDSIYELKFLTSQDSWTLFCRNTFRDNTCPVYLKDIADDILGKCEGLPLAIVAISGLLASKDFNRIEWEKVRRRLSDEFEGIGKLERVKTILFLSYNDLPSTLKACLLYTSIFPEDHEIRCYHIIRLWAAEKFVERRAGLTDDDVAWDYLKELANRSLIQMSKILDGGLARYFHIHDLLREVIVSESRKQNMMTIIETSKERQTDWATQKRVRRIVFHNCPLSRESHSYFKKLRSIGTFGWTEPPSKALLKDLLSSKFLKVLNFRGMQFEEIPEEIFNLFHLTYLHLTGTGVKRVSKSIKSLQNLEYLDLRGTQVRKLPKEITKLKKLHHLLVYQEVDYSDVDSAAFGFGAPRKMGELLDLQTLGEIDVAGSDKAILSEIGKLVQLRSIAITNLRREDGRELCSSIENFSNLQELVISSSIQNDGSMLDLNYPIPASSLQYLCWLYLRGRLEKMPPWIRDLQSLGEVKLNWSCLRDDPLESLQHLPNLIQISLNQAYEGETLHFIAGGFRKLKTLYLKSMSALRWVIMEEGSMPGISHLTMQELPLVEELPHGIENLRQLQKLEILSMSSQLTKNLENEAFEESDDYKKLAHIPQVVLGLQRDGRWISRQLSRKKKAHN